MTDNFYEEEIIIPERRIEKYNYRSTKEIFNHMRESLEEYNRRLKENIFSSYERKYDDAIFSEAYRVTIEELMLTI